MARMSAVKLTPEAANAIADFQEQLAKLMGLYDTNPQHPNFVRWRMTTTEVFKHHLPHSSSYLTFANISFTTSSWTEAYGDGDARNPFNRGCIAAKACIEGAIEHIQMFGLDAPKDQRPAPRPATESGGVHFHGGVSIQNLAVAADDAVQNVNQYASKEGEALKQVGDILRESGELKQREVAQALDVIAKLATEMHKPKDRWNWRSVFEWTDTLLKIAPRATDVAARLAHHIPVLVALYETAEKMLR
jgi:hypothetical protein